MTTETAPVTLRLFGALRDAVGQKEVALPCAGSTASEALAWFVQHSEAGIRRLVFNERGELWRSIILLLNDEPVKDGGRARLKAGDTLSLLLPMAGGAQQGRGHRCPTPSWSKRKRR